MGHPKAEEEHGEDKGGGAEDKKADVSRPGSGATDEVLDFLVGGLATDGQIPCVVGPQGSEKENCETDIEYAKDINRSPILHR